MTRRTGGNHCIILHPIRQKRNAPRRSLGAQNHFVHRPFRRENGIVFPPPKNYVIPCEEQSPTKEQHHSLWRAPAHRRTTSFPMEGTHPTEGRAAYRGATSLPAEGTHPTEGRGRVTPFSNARRARRRNWASCRCTQGRSRPTSRSHTSRQRRSPARRPR